MTAVAEVGGLLVSPELGELSVNVTNVLLDTVQLSMALSDGSGRGIVHEKYNDALVSAEAASELTDLDPGLVALAALLNGVDTRVSDNCRVANQEHNGTSSKILYEPYCEDELPALVTSFLDVLIDYANGANAESAFHNCFVDDSTRSRQNTVDDAAIADMESDFKISDIAAFEQALDNIRELGMKYGNVLRVPKYASGERESDVQHSVMLMLAAINIAIEISKERKIPIDISKVVLYSLVHDFPEIYAGDVQTFHQTDEDKRLKVANEEKAMARLRNDLPDFWLDTLEAYEAQEDFESAFVCAIDKLLPSAVDIYGQGIAVITEDYKVTSLSGLKIAHAKHEDKLEKRFREKLGSTLDILALSHKTLNRMFEHKVAIINGANNSNGSEWTDTELKLSEESVVRFKRTQELAA